MLIPIDISFSTPQKGLNNNLTLCLVSASSTSSDVGPARQAKGQVSFYLSHAGTAVRHSLLTKAAVLP